MECTCLGRTQRRSGRTRRLADAAFAHEHHEMARGEELVEPDQDLNGNGIVDPQDFSILKSYFGKKPGPSGLVP